MITAKFALALDAAVPAGVPGRALLVDLVPIHGNRRFQVLPILDRDGRAVAALSVATVSDRLGPDRLPMVVDMLKREAALIGPRINPFDPLLRRPSQVFGQG
ncbi:hypothetical protein SAMN03159474_03848 [Pseudomonas sp. NFACC08-1]|nr:hypothetical protein SAMN03159474_03848 [Pseudomonas sp. NFACC08-1]SFL10044.1 hypothetical protein SAMN03159307_00665 [Pseudomonas sp. NFACC46-3]